MDTTVTIEDFVARHCSTLMGHAIISFGDVEAAIYGAGSPVGLRLIGDETAKGSFLNGRYYGSGPSEEYRVLTKTSDADYEFMGNPVRVIDAGNLERILRGQVTCDDLWTTEPLRRGNFPDDMPLPIRATSGKWVLSYLGANRAMIVGDMDAMVHDATIGLSIGNHSDAYS